MDEISMFTKLSAVFQLCFQTRLRWIPK